MKNGLFSLLASVSPETLAELRKAPESESSFAVYQRIKDGTATDEERAIYEDMQDWEKANPPGVLTEPH